MWYLPNAANAILINTGDAENSAGSALEPVINDAYRSFLQNS
jgi:hypothetical protein